jgi:mono/diheme cytochrome c family protein
MRKRIATTLALAFMIGCGGGGGAGGEGGGSATAGGESPYAGPLRSTDVALGQAKYESRCASCHESGAPAVANLHWTVERMRRQIREGSGQMPPIPEHRLNADEMDALIAYLGTVGGVDIEAEPSLEATAN